MNPKLLTLGLLLFAVSAITARLHAQTAESGEALFAVTVKTEGDILEPSGEPGRFSMTRDQIAWGEGQVEGSRLTGELDFSLLAKTPADDGRINVFFVGWIFLPDGVELMYEAEGWADPKDPEQPHRWHVSATMEFRETEGPYDSLRSTEAAWVGVFDADLGTGSFRVVSATSTGSSVLP